MYLIRQATADDLPTLLKLARMVHFINLPADKDIIAGKIARSRLSFAGQAPSEREREFMFVLEQVESEHVIGTSSILSCISWPGHPHTYLKVRRRERFSKDLQTGMVHITLELGTDESGPSEMGGLILAPGYRGLPDRLGSLLSLVRFHYIGLHRELFSRKIIAEMMGALTPDSRNLLWEYLGRRFINLQYTEADRFCQHSKEFITALFPTGEIYASLLPPEARNLIGKVGDETRGALKMLESQGFVSEDHVDPFDGGPYLSADRDSIPLVLASRQATLGDPQDPHPRDAATVESFVSFEGEDGFRAVRCLALVDGDSVSIAAESAGLIGAQPGDTIGFTPLGHGKAAGGRSADQSRESQQGPNQTGGAGTNALQPSPRQRRGSQNNQSQSPARKSSASTRTRRRP